MLNLKEIEKRCAKATEGPWWNESSIIHCKGPKWTDENHSCIHPVSCEDDDDADFVAEARTDLPECIRLLREAREIIFKADAWWKIEDKERAERWLSEVKDEEK